MASMRDIKRRKGSIQSTQQITKAMKLVSTVKLQKAKTRAEQTNPYFNYMYQTVTSMLAKSGTMNHPYLKSGGSEKKAVVVITSNRGLAGGYNSNIVKLVTASEDLTPDHTEVYAIGSKGQEALERRGYEIKESSTEIIESPSYADAAELCKQLLKLLPVEFDKEEIREEKSSDLLMNYEPGEEEALDLIIPKYVTSLFYGALIEAVASENGARMQAMDSATSNAEEMISDLTLKYNRARQGSITQELTEIIAGASAIS